jgi:hypothetical protein
VVVRQYYAALNRRDVEAARRTWKTPPPRLQDMIQQVDWYRMEDIRLLQGDTSAAQVEVSVIGKRRNQQPERWSGTVELEKISGEWKIAQMRLTRQTSDVKASRPTDAKTPGLPTQPLPGALPWPGDTSSPQGNIDTGGKDAIPRDTAVPTNAEGQSTQAFDPLAWINDYVRVTTQP